MRTSRLLAASLVVLSAAGCSRDTSPSSDPESGHAALPTAPSAIQHQAVPDLSGSWDWTTEEQLRMPESVAALVGVIPEGPNTLARCESAGTMTLVQSGSSFSGTAQRTANACETSGGQAFVQPDTSLQVADGRITGRHARFLFQSAVVRPCPYQAVIAASGGLATALDGGGHCVLPGHPQSDSPLPFDPPPGGTSNALRWSATRP